VTIERTLRHVRLDGPLNFRDIGGYSGSRGAIALGRVYRSDALCGLSENDLARLVNDLGVRSVVDLRRQDELDAAPNAFQMHDRVRYYHSPVFEIRGTTDEAEYLRTLDFAAHYVSMIRRGSDSFALIFRLLAREECAPLVFHCTAGRDRTGVAATLLLLAAGAEREDVIADYLLSDELLGPRVDWWRANLVARGLDPEPVLENVRPRPEYLMPMLATIEQEFGGIDGYLASIGVTRAELDAFRRLVLT
jgi:protein-tyrosine phosphatase